VPSVLETIGLRLVWLVVAINLAGTAFGFWYYSQQLSQTATEMWIFVPDSPMATLFIAGAFALWAVDRSNDYLSALAFFGNIKLGLWTPWVLVIFADAFLEFTAPAMYAFLLVSHLAMVVQAFVLHRITDFPVAAVGLALAWYTVDLTVDYFIPIVGDPHHTAIPVPYETQIAAGATAFQLAAWGAVVLTVVPLFWALVTRIKQLEHADA
jgi:uncharacterized membrane protein YpjA